MVLPFWAVAALGAIGSASVARSMTCLRRIGHSLRSSIYDGSVIAGLFPIKAGVRLFPEYCRRCTETGLQGRKPVPAGAHSPSLIGSTPAAIRGGPEAERTRHWGVAKW